MTRERELVVFYDETFRRHVPPEGTFSLPPDVDLGVTEPHPDRWERTANVQTALRNGFPSIRFPDVTPATQRELERVHTYRYLDRLHQAAESGTTRLTPTTVVTESTYTAARYAAGASIQAAEAALTRRGDETGYALVRPSGHHAQSDRADGFCFINNVGVAADHVISTERAERVAILDWDVHHGNGTQELFYDRDDVLVVSLHNDHGSWNASSHPQTGALDERGTGSGLGYTVNCPLPLGTGDTGYEYAFDCLVRPIITAFEPDLLLVSAGQDPGVLDPLGGNVVSADGFRTLGESVRLLADDVTDGALGFVQEGGYHLSHLLLSTLAVIEGATGKQVLSTKWKPDPFAWPDENDVLCREWVDEAISVHADHWPVE